MSNPVEQQSQRGTQASHWSSLSEAGTLKGILFLLWVHRTCGRSIFSTVLYPIIAYYFLSNRRARNASLDYVKTHYAKYPESWSKPPGYIDVYRHLYSFGQSILDKLIAWTTPLREEDFEIYDKEALISFLDNKSGQLIIGSHFGNLEYCRGFVHRYKKKVINALVYDQHAANFVNAMQSLNPESRIHIYQVDNLEIPVILELKEKIENGEWLFIAGDRIPLSGESRTTTVSFLDREAPMPIGPYMLAKILGCEVQLMFSYRKNKKIYFELVPFSDRIHLSRKESEKDLQAYAQKFAFELEKQTVFAPKQWFNFYPYWNANTSARYENTKNSH